MPTTCKLLGFREKTDTYLVGPSIRKIGWPRQKNCTGLSFFGVFNGSYTFTVSFSVRSTHLSLSSLPGGLLLLSFPVIYPDKIEHLIEDLYLFQKLISKTCFHLFSPTVFNQACRLI